MEQLDGVLVLNKPKGMSSAYALNAIKRLGQKKIGHAGTLDPMATGVLIVLLGQATKLSNYLLEGGKKVYEGVLELGKVTDTWDIEGQILETNGFADVTIQDLTNEIEYWKKNTSQVVPPFSAAKHKGKPLYKLAREGKEVPVKIKEIKISQAEILLFESPFMRFRVECSSGTYIRSLAHSLGSRVGVGACLTELTRVYSHPYSIEEASNLDDLAGNFELLQSRIKPISSVLDWQIFAVDEKIADDIIYGKAIPHNEIEKQFPEIIVDFGDKAFFETKDGKALALMEAKYQEGYAKPVWTILRGLWQNH